MPITSVSFGFPPISGTSAQVLILGSLPGEVSIKRQEYYAQPRNIFWRIMGDLFGIAPERSYIERVAGLVDNDIAVWDVCATAHRPGSLDSNIHAPSVKVNDFKMFLSQHPRITFICFNGAKAGALFEGQVAPTLDAALRNISRKVLPSTSPAHASLSYEAKRTAWDVVRQRVGS